MRLRQIVAALLAVAIGTPAWAVDPAWFATSISATGPTNDQTACYVHGTTNKISCVNQAATSKTNAMWLLAFDGSTKTPTVTNFDGCTLSTSTWGNALGFGGNATTIRIGGGGQSGNGGNWTCSAPLSSPTTWTVVRDSAGPVGNNSGYLGLLEDFGSRDCLLSTVQSKSGLCQGGLYTITASPFAATGPTEWSYASQVCKDADTAIKVASNYSFSAHAGNSDMALAGYAGSGTSFAFSKVSCTVGPATATAVIRPPITDGTSGVAVATDGTDSFICGANVSGTVTVKQTINSANVRTGVYHTLGGSTYLRTWTSTGLEYSASAGGTSPFVRESAYDIPSGVLNGATVLQVVKGADCDGDGSTTVDMLAFLSSGNIACYGYSGITPTTRVIGGRTPPSLSGSL